jgi:hypothetical protein
LQPGPRSRRFKVQPIESDCSDYETLTFQEQLSQLDSFQIQSQPASGEDSYERMDT